MGRQASGRAFVHYSAGQIILRVAQRIGIGMGVVALGLGALDYVRVNPFAYASRFSSPAGEANLEQTVVVGVPESARGTVTTLPPRAEIKIAALVPAPAPTIPDSHAELVSPPVTTALLRHSSLAMVLPTSLLPIENPPPMTSPLPDATPQPAVFSGPVPLPRPAPGAPPPSPAELLSLKGKDYAKAERCLANAIYFESRSEPVRGQMAVAQVVINRVFSGFYPNNVCDVVYQNAHRHLACQFTFACDGKRKLINERGAWARANRIAKQTLDGKIYVPEVAKSTHYHAAYVRPNWIHEMKRMVRYGIHSFYRPYAWGNGADEPAWGSGAVAASKTKTAAK